MNFLKKIVYVFIFIVIIYIIYILYNNRFELFITNLDEIKRKGWNMDNSKNGNLICSNEVCELVCDTGYKKSNGICCGNGKYNSNGKCCPIDTVNVEGNCMSRADADTKFQRDISQFLDIQYHKTDAQLMEEAEPTDVQFGNTFIYDENGKKIPYPSSSVQGNITYYTPGAYPFGTANYVPNYADSIYLSKLTGQSTTTPVYNTSKMLSGFCSYFEDQPQKKEEVCNKLDPNACASTNCCVLLGGSKCVSGNISGPSYKRNYGDVFLRNKDYYYYQGKCYGNCQ